MIRKKIRTKMDLFRRHAKELEGLIIGEPVKYRGPTSYIKGREGFARGVKITDGGYKIRVQWMRAAGQLIDIDDPLCRRFWYPHELEFLNEGR